MKKPRKEPENPWINAARELPRVGENVEVTDGLSVRPAVAGFGGAIPSMLTLRVTHWRYVGEPSWNI